MNRFSRNPLGPGVIRVSKKSQNEAELFIYGDIGSSWWDEGVSAEDFAKELSALDVGTITVQLNSMGGSVFEGIAIYNALSSHPANVVVNVNGIAASIASVIAMAGDEIRISEGSHIMIHKPWSLAMGDAESMRKEAEVLDKLETGIIDIYQARTGAKRADLEAWIASETWFLGQEAVDAGFADECIPAKKKEKKPASAMLNLFKHPPKELFEHKNTPAIRDFEALLRDGEGFSHSVAKRVASIASKAFDIPRRDDDGAPLPGVTDKELSKIIANSISILKTKED